MDKLKGLYGSDIDELLKTIGKLIAVSNNSDHLTENEKNLSLNLLLKLSSLFNENPTYKQSDFKAFFNDVLFDEMFPQKLTNDDLPPEMVKKLLPIYQKDRGIKLYEAKEKIALVTGKKPESLNRYMYGKRKR